MNEPDKITGHLLLRVYTVLIIIDIVSKIEKRGEFAYILNHEAGLYVGRFLGAVTLLLLAYTISTEIALRYAIIIIAVLQLSALFVAKKIIEQGKLHSPEEDKAIDMRVLNEVAEVIV